MEFEVFVSERRHLMRLIEQGSLKDALQFWKPDEEDWAVLSAFALRSDLPFELYD